MAMTMSAFRANLSQVVDKVLATGVPVEIVRKGRIVRIVPDKPASKLSRLKKRRGLIQGDPEDLVHMDWSGEWKF